MPYQKVAKCREHKRIIAKSETWPLAFYKIINKSAVTSTTSGRHDYPFEFPVSFVEEYTRLMGALFSNVTLKRAFGDTVWPAAVTERDVGRAAKRVFMYGPDGWKKFVEDNGVKEGHMVVFVLMEPAGFVVYKFPTCGRCESCTERQEQIDSRG